MTVFAGFQSKKWWDHKFCSVCGVLAFGLELKTMPNSPTGLKVSWERRVSNLLQASQDLKIFHPSSRWKTSGINGLSVWSSEAKGQIWSVVYLMGTFLNLLVWPIGRQRMRRRNKRTAVLHRKEKGLLTHRQHTRMKWNARQGCSIELLDSWWECNSSAVVH